MMTVSVCLIIHFFYAERQMLMISHTIQRLWFTPALVERQSTRALWLWSMIRTMKIIIKKIEFCWSRSQIDCVVDTTTFRYKQKTTDKKKQLDKWIVCRFRAILKRYQWASPEKKRNIIFKPVLRTTFILETKIIWKEQKFKFCLWSSRDLLI